jgi:hypothetical protein
MPQLRIMFRGGTNPYLERDLARGKIMTEDGGSTIVVIGSDEAEAEETRIAIFPADAVYYVLLLP